MSEENLPPLIRTPPGLYRHYKGGMYRVEEKKLEFLNAAQHKNLIKKGIMGRIYAHIISIDNFARLLTRKNAAEAKA